MASLKTISIIAVTFALSSVSSNAFAQSAPTGPAAQPIASATAPAVKRIVKRVVEPLPVLATPKAAEKSKLYARAPYSEAVSGRVNKFIINNSNQKVSTPVYFSVDALKSR